MNPEQPPQQATQVRTILIAEDEPFLLKVLAQTFEQAGFQVLRAPDGEVALQLATTHHPLVCVLDIMMPKMDGLTVLQHIRQDALWGKGAMVIMLTNLTADSQILEGMAKNPPSYYFVKANMDPDQLLAKVQELLGKGQE
jgi:CheY-like chemotaxis protein